MVVGNAILIGWTGIVPGREKRALEHFMEFHTWLEELKGHKTITGYTDVILTPNANTVGFILITGEPAKLADLYRSDKWTEHTLRASLNNLGQWVQTATTGEGVPGLIQTWAKYI
jgi:hypothetical protein